MTITKENLGELDLCIKVEIEENDYAEQAAKELKDYQRKAVVPGFRPGKAPMALIQRKYYSVIVGSVVEDMLSKSLFDYIDNEKLDIIGSPLSNTEKTGTIDFENEKAFTFYFDAALFPTVNIEWEKVDVKHYGVEVTDERIDERIKSLCEAYGKFEESEEVMEGDTLYGSVAELDDEGNKKEDGLHTYCAIRPMDYLSAEAAALFMGKKKNETIEFVPAQTFTKEAIERIFREETPAPQMRMQMELSGMSHTILAEVNAELFEKAYPGRGIQDVEGFRQAVAEEMKRSDTEGCQDLFVRDVTRYLTEHYITTIPEAFLKRLILSRSEDKDLTAEKLDEQWETTYLPSLKQEVLDKVLNDIQSIEPTQNEMVDHVKGILSANEQSRGREIVEDVLEQTARRIVEEGRSTSSIAARIRADKEYALFKEKINPSIEIVSLEELQQHFA